MKLALDAATVDRIFREARSYRHWESAPVDDVTIRALYDLAKWGPTSMNSSPARFVFVRSQEAKSRVAPCLDEGNVAKLMAAPCCVILAWDTKFYELLPRLVPAVDLRPKFSERPDYAHETAFRNATLQGAYLMIAARALGLDVGPMSGFDNEAVDKEFFPNGRWRSNFLCNIGRGCDARLYPRLPRLEFEEACIEL